MQATILNREIALKMINKSITDIVAVISMLVALVTGFMLHNEIHHSHIYHDVRLWSRQIWDAAPPQPEDFGIAEPADTEVQATLEPARNLWTCLDGYYGIALCAAYSLV